jgi:TM2 domain-containing membrane protein YozV
MNCTQCGSSLDLGAAFCADCGTASQKPEPAAAEISPALPFQTAVGTERPSRPCPFCGEQILTAAIKCRFCGSNLTAGAPLAQAPGGITLNAPSVPAMPSGGGYAAAPSIIIQNVQATQAPVAVHSGIYKNPGIAFVLSFIFPGGGQFYNGHVGKGIFVLLTFWALGITYIWSLFDAPLSAQRINRLGF